MQGSILVEYRCSFVERREQILRWTRICHFASPLCCTTLASGWKSCVGCSSRWRKICCFQLREEPDAQEEEMPLLREELVIFHQPGNKEIEKQQCTREETAWGGVFRFPNPLATGSASWGMGLGMGLGEWEQCVTNDQTQNLNTDSKTYFATIFFSTLIPTQKSKP